MDLFVESVIVLIALVLMIVTFLAQIRLFSIDRSLKQIRVACSEIESAQSSCRQIPRVAALGAIRPIQKFMSDRVKVKAGSAVIALSPGMCRQKCRQPKTQVLLLKITAAFTLVVSAGNWPCRTRDALCAADIWAESAAW